jgi:hypothetical protein
MLAADASAAAKHAEWEVTIAIRITGGSRDRVRVRLALPADGPARRVKDLEVISRGLMTEVQKGDEPHILFSGRVRTARRVAVTFIVDSASIEEKLPAVVPITDPPADLLPFLGPAPHFQARSILVREFLETHVGPVIKKSSAPFLESIFAVTRRELAWHRDGSGLALDVIRARGGKRIGIERAFTTFLRCAGIPARFVEGLDLKSRTRKKRVFWTEVWAEDTWWPLSASRGWIGRMPRSYVALARNGTRVIEVDGPATASYAVFAQQRREEIAAVR